ncbi:hypothetical protein [Brevibacillus panacihumi]|uniref:hypothetical protein n=1 Tax=Brevibacillus panacihumi TaxID=497735 RepID=UPI001494CF5D|nr:hypothetical protein [Brevibacillus panacihumi]
MFPGGATSGVQLSGTAKPGETEAQPMSKLAELRAVLRFPRDRCGADSLTSL